MRFENAYKGIGNIITAEVLSIIATVTGVLTAVLGAVAYAAEMEKIKEVLDYTIGGFTILGIITLVLLALSFIINIIGLAKAGKDDSEFVKALVEILIAVVALVAGVYFDGKNDLIKTVCNAILSVINTIVMMHVVNGIANLADKMFNSKMINKGKTVTILIMVAFGLKALAEIVLKFFFKDPKANINVILSLVSALAQIIQYLFYIGYLGKARKMLRA